MRKRRKGIAILIAMFMMVLVIMFVTAVVSLLPQSVDSARNTREGREAIAAAQAGVDYAWCRLQENPNWKGDGAAPGNTAAWTINTPTLQVYEDHGNVWGFMTNSSGDKSQFRIRFNFQDGGGLGAEGLNDPAAAYMIKNPYVSYNNLSVPTITPVKRGVAAGNMPITGASVSPYNVAPFSVAVLVEGRAGDGMRTTTTAAPNPPAATGRRVVTHITEVHLTRPMLANLDSAIYGDSVTASVTGSVLDIRSATAATPRARSLNGFAVTAGNLSMAATGRVMYGNSTNPPVYTVNSTTPTKVYEDKSVQAGKFLKIKTADTPQANPATDATLPAGTYIWRVNGTIDYYPQEYVAGVVPPHGTAGEVTLSSTADLTSLIAGAGQTGPGAAAPIIMDPTTYTLEYSKSVYVKPQGAVTGLSIIPEAAVGTFPTPDRPKNLFNGIAGTTPVLTGTTALNLDGALLGKGSISAGTNVTFQGPSVFETDPGESVAVYAKKDVNMLALPPDVATNLNPTNGSPNHHALHHRNHHSYNNSGRTNTNAFLLASIPNAIGALDGNDVMVAGLVYAGGNFTTNLGSGTMYMRGALVAYGGNTDVDDLPGTLGGVVNITSKGAQVDFDPTYIANSLQLSGPGRLVLALQNSY